MGKQKLDNATEDNLFDFDVNSIFGDFTPSIETKKLEENDESADGGDEDDKLDPKDDKVSKPEDPLEEDKDDDDDGDSDNEEDESVDNGDTNSKDSDGSNDGDITGDGDEEEIEYSYKGIAEYLAEKGLIDYEDSEDMEDSEEVLEKAVESTVQNLITEYRNSIPEVGQQFLDYVQNGGKPEEFFQSLEKPLDFNSIDLEDESTQKRVIRELLKEQKYSQEEIDEHIQDYEDGLILDKRAKTAARKLEEIYNKKQESLIKQQEKIKEAEAKQYAEYVESIKETINTSDNLAGLKINRSDKKAFEEYLLTVDKDGKTKYQREVEKDPVKTQLELAYLKFKNYDFSKASKQGKTEASKTIRKMIRNTDKVRSTRSKHNDSSGSGSVDLSDFKSFL